MKSVRTIYSGISRLISPLCKRKNLIILPVSKVKKNGYARHGSQFIILLSLKSVGYDGT